MTGGEPRLVEARRAFEAVVLVADDPVEPQLLAQLLEVPVAEVEARMTVVAPT